VHQDVYPFLKSLQGSIASLSKKLAGNEAVAFELRAIGKVVDYLLVHHTQLQGLQKEMYAAVQELLPAVKAMLADGDPAAAHLAGMAEIIREQDAASFDPLLASMQQLTHALFAAGTEEARSLAKQLSGIEGAFQGKFKTAVTRMSEQTAALNPAAARNTREYDQKALEGFLRNAFPEEKALSVRHSDFLMGGSSKFTMAIDLSGVASIPQSLILRADASGMFGGADCVQEYRLFKVLHENGVCVPRPLAVEPSGQVFGSPFLVMERRPGKTLCMGFEPPKIPNEKACESIATALARLHKVPAGKFADALHSKYKTNSAKVLSWLDEGSKAWTPLGVPSPSIQTAFDWLRANVALMDKAPRTLMHADFSLHNLLVHHDSLSAILDWEFADFGNPFYDLGYFHYMATGLSSWTHFLSCYEKESAFGLDENQLDYCCLLAATRLGIMNIQAIALFNQGANIGVFMSVVVSDDYYGQTITRINQWLDKVIR
jgi:aminoglycoside phosphotransferase (APT) family kinase protein